MKFALLEAVRNVFKVINQGLGLCLVIFVVRHDGLESFDYRFSREPSACDGLRKTWIRSKVLISFGNAFVYSFNASHVCIGISLIR